jgi:hypothetical protein
MPHFEEIPISINEREKERPEFIEFSLEDLLTLMEAKNFLRALKIAAKETKQSDYETGFWVTSTKDKKFQIKAVMGGGPTSMEGMEELQDINGDKAWLKELGDKSELQECSLLDIHFHPSQQDDAITPSGSDLKVFTRQGIPLGFMGIGQVRKSGNIDLLLIRSKPGFLLEDAQDYEEEIAPFDFCNQETVGEILKKYDLDNFLITFNFKNGNYQLTEESKELILRLKKFKVKLINFDLNDND